MGPYLARASKSSSYSTSSSSVDITNEHIAGSSDSLPTKNALSPTFRISCVKVSERYENTPLNGTTRSICHGMWMDNVYRGHDDCHSRKMNADEAVADLLARTSDVDAHTIMVTLCGVFITRRTWHS